jgi:NADPH:quinone reductase-like Zn-dependent oxidoreductase
VIATVSGDAKARLAKAAGARHVISYKDADAAERIRRVAPDGVDLIAEVAAGANAHSTKPSSSLAGRSRSMRTTAAPRSAWTCGATWG